MTMDELKPKQSAYIRSVGGDGVLRHHLLDMGLTLRTEVTLQKIAPMGDPVQIELRGYELTLRFDEARKIEIEKVHTIPKEAQADILVTADDAEKMKALAREIEKEIQGELASKDPEFAIELTVGNDDQVKDLTGKVLTAESTERVLSCLAALPNGVQAVAHLAGASLCTQGDYPGWAYRNDSPLRDKMVRIYEVMFGKKPQLQAIHAGLECGMFADKLPGLDCVSIGPDMHDIHTADECLDIASTQRTWQFLVAVLEAKDCG